ncbi:MAG: right-handed parallel beta-helix repeat-containing protein [Terriglobia bacterium]
MPSHGAGSGGGPLKCLANYVTRHSATMLVITALLGVAMYCSNALAQNRAVSIQEAVTDSAGAGVSGSTARGAQLGSRVSRQGRVWVVAQSNPRASDEGSGTAEEPFKTIGRAALLAEPGDTVLVQTGVYRERVAPARGGEKGRPIVYMAVPGETVIVKGSDVLSGPFLAVDQSHSIYMVKLDPAVFRGANPYATPAAIFPADLKFAPSESLHKTLGQIFVDGIPFVEVDDSTQLRAVPSSWMAIKGGFSLLIHFSPQMGDPSHHLVEYSVRDRVFAPYKRGLGYITVRGFTFEDCANPRLGDFWKPAGHQTGMLSTRSGNHWIIEDNVIRYAKSLGLDFGAGGAADRGPNPVPQSEVGWDQILDNTIADNGQAGAAGAGSHFVEIVGNRFERNNALGWPSYEAAGLKTHFFFNGVIEGNLFLDNDCPAIWLDNTFSHDRISRNLILNSVEEGIFVEMGFGPLLIDNNVVAYTRAGDGIYAHDSSGITVAHNLLLADAGWGIRMRVISNRKARDTGQTAVNSSTNVLVETSNERIVENLLIDNYGGAISLPPHWNRSRNNESDFNVFATGSQRHWGGVFAPVFAFDNCGGRISPEELKRDVFGHLSSLPKDRRPDSGLWPDIQLLTLDQWQAISGYEAHSAIANFKIPSTINTDSLMLSLKVQEFPWKMRNVPAVAGVSRDYFGRPLPLENPLAGPFQSLHPSVNDILLVQETPSLHLADSGAHWSIFDLAGKAMEKVNPSTAAPARGTQERLRFSDSSCGTPIRRQKQDCYPTAPSFSKM